MTRYLPLTLSLLLAACGELEVDRNGATDPGTETPDPTTAIDADGDGYTSDVDCDDRAGDGNGDGQVDGYFTNPGATEICDGIDNDCDTAVDDGLEQFQYFVDADGDGFGSESIWSCQTEATEGYATVDGDCNDADAAFHPGAEDVPGDGLDTDCDDETQPEDDETSDGSEDNGDDDSGSGDTGDGEDTGSGDDEGDTGDTDEPDEEPPVDADTDGYTDEVDCDDSDAATNPGATEECGDEIDNDCSGGDASCSTPDSDGDGSTDDVDCEIDDANVYPGATETADGLDNDCDTVVDEGTSAYDDDGDGYSESAGDCDDSDEDLNPGETESDNGEDDDCDGSVDEGMPSTTDADADGFYADEDCDEGDPEVNPGASEYDAGLDDEDNDCDSAVDEDWQAIVEVTYPNSGYYVLNAGFYTSGTTPNALGWQETDTQTSGTDMSVEFTTSEYGDMSSSCGLIINVNEGNPASSWLCENWEVDSSVAIDAWFDGVWYDESDVTEWIADDASGSCAAIIQVDTSSACDPVDDE